MYFKNLSKREGYLAFATVAIGLSALMYNFIIDPISGRWIRLNNEIEAKLNMLKKDSHLLAMYKTLESDYAKFSQYAKSTKKEEEELAAILSEIETISRSNSCLIASIKPLGTKNFPSYKEMWIDAAIEADINQFSKFLYDIETSKIMMLKVRRFTISSKSGEPRILKGTFLISKILIE